MKRIQKNSQTDCSEIFDMLGHEEDVDIKLELELQLDRERKSAADLSEFSKLADMMESREGFAYRSGDRGGERYMTNDDYNRIILEKTRIPSYCMDAESSEKITRRPAAVYNVMGCGKAMVGTGFAASVCENVIDGKDFSVARVERTDTNLIGAVIRLLDQWFPAHTSEKQKRAYRRRLAGPAAGIAWVVIFALVLSLPIVLGVLKSDAASVLNAKQKELYALEKTEEELRAEFESSLDLREIESIAMNEIGMIKLNDSTVKLLRLNEIDTIESFSEKKSNSVVPALLSALGIRASDE